MRPRARREAEQRVGAECCNDEGWQLLLLYCWRSGEVVEVSAVMRRCRDVEKRPTQHSKETTKGSTDLLLH